MNNEKEYPKLMTKEAILQRVGDDVIVLLSKEPFYAYMLVKMRKVIDQRVPVAGVSVVNGVITLYINAEGYMNYTKEERLFILKHEVMHIINIHYLRRRGRDPKLFNVAADVAINQLIESQYCKFPADALRINSWENEENGFVLPEKLSAEEYYNILFKRKENLQLPQDLLNSIIGKHLSGQSCEHCGGTGKEPKPEKITGVIETVNRVKNQVEVKGKIIQIHDDTEVSHVDELTFAASDLKTGMIAEIESKKIGAVNHAESLKVIHIKGKVKSLMKDSFEVDDYIINVKDDTLVKDLNGDEIDFSEVEEGQTVTVLEKFFGYAKGKTKFEALEIHFEEENEEENENNEDSSENDENSEGGGHDHGDEGHEHGDGEECSCCGGTGKEPGSGSGSGSGSGGLEGLHPTWDESTDISEDLAENIVKSLVSEAYQKSRGNVPGSIKQMIEEMLQSKINWRSVLRNFVAKRTSTKKTATWRKQNRRLGKMVPGHKKNKKLNLAVAVDTSGSVSDTELAMFTAEIQKIYQNGADITVIECDATVQNVYPYTKKLERNGGMTYKGRGGTDFRPVFEYIMDSSKTKVKPDAVIFLTDGYGPAPDVFKIPTLWCLTPGGQRPYGSSYHNEVSWGSVLKLED